MCPLAWKFVARTSSQKMSLGHTRPPPAADTTAAPRRWLSPMHTSNNLNVKTILIHADGITWIKKKTMLWPQEHNTTGQCSLRCSRIRVVSAEGTSLLHPNCTALYNTPALDCKLQHALRNPWIRSMLGTRYPASWHDERRADKNDLIQVSGIR